MNYDLIPKSNLHTHTVFSDGAHTPEENVLKAIELGMKAIGFSDHSQLACGEDWSLSEEGEKQYKAEVLRLKRLYGDRICILLGVEQDFCSVSSPYGWDFVIGSVHMLHRGGKYHAVDLDREDLVRTVEEYFDNSFLCILCH